MRKKILSAAALALLLILALTACGKKLEDRLAGSWYAEGRSKPEVILYDDGTCEIDREYGTGYWTVVNDKILKLTTFYGESTTAEIVSLDDGCMTVQDAQGNTAQLWNTPQN